MKNFWKLGLALALFVSSASDAAAPASPPNGARDHMQAGTGSYGCTAGDIAHYVARRAAGLISVDGRLEEPSWQLAEKSPRFVDMVSGEPGFYDTRAAVLWDDYTWPAARGRGLQTRAILRRLRDAAAGGAGTMIIGAVADNLVSRHNIEKLGFTYWASHAKAAREFDYEPRALRDGLRQTLRAEGWLA